MNMTRAITILSITLATALAGAAPATPTDPYTDANTAAARGDHVAAAKAFERAIETGGWSANVLLGLANAYASSGDHGRAVLALERARLIAPRDPAVAQNLARVRETVGLDAPRPSRLDRTVRALTSDDWALLAFGGLAFACAGVLALAWTARGRRISTAALVCGAAIAVGAGVAAREVVPAANEVIVVESQQARIAPFGAAETAFALRAGERANIEQRRGDFVYLRVDDDRAGWVPASAIEQVVPSDRRSDDG